MKSNDARAAWMVGVAGLLMIGFVACGSDKKDDNKDDSPAAAKLTFTADIDLILKASCAGSTCHDSAGTGTRYVGQESAFKNSTSASELRSGAMPKTGTITAANKQKLLDFLAQ